MEESKIPAAPLQSILCTEELLSRPSRPPDYRVENSALVALTSALTDSPHTILQTLADSTALNIGRALANNCRLLWEMRFSCNR